MRRAVYYAALVGAAARRQRRASALRPRSIDRRKMAAATANSGATLFARKEDGKHSETAPEGAQLLGRGPAMLILEETILDGGLLTIRRQNICARHSAEFSLHYIASALTLLCGTISEPGRFRRRDESTTPRRFRTHAQRRGLM